MNAWNEAKIQNKTKEVDYLASSVPYHRREQMRTTLLEYASQLYDLLSDSRLPPIMSNVMNQYLK